MIIRCKNINKMYHKATPLSLILFIIFLNIPLTNKKHKHFASKFNINEPFISNHENPDEHLLLTSLTS